MATSSQQQEFVKWLGIVVGQDVLQVIVQAMIKLTLAVGWIDRGNKVGIQFALKRAERGRMAAVSQETLGEIPVGVGAFYLATILLNPREKFAIAQQSGIFDRRDPWFYRHPIILHSLVTLPHLISDVLTQIDFKLPLRLGLHLPDSLLMLVGTVFA